MSSHILVTAAILPKGDGRYLITQRKKDAKHFPNFWEFNGGTFEPNKDRSLEDCLKREVHEELELIIKVGNFFGMTSYNEVDLVGFYCDIISGEIQRLEIQDYKWVHPNEMKNYNFCPADLYFIEELKRESIKNL